MIAKYCEYDCDDGCSRPRDLELNFSGFLVSAAPIYIYIDIYIDIDIDIDIYI